MNGGANVQSIQALEDLRGTLARFGSEAQGSLRAVDLEIRRTMDWLQERLNHWRNEVLCRKAEVDQARIALARCEASGYYDDQGYYHAPNCSAFALLQAKTRLQEAEAELHSVQGWTRLVQQATADYQAQARRLTGLLGADLPKVTALLGRKAATLHSYAAISVPLVESVPIRDNLSGVLTAADVGVQEPFEPKEPREPGPVTPPEIREGTVGGPERRG